MEYHLLDMYEGNVEASFDTQAELIDYLKKRKRSGNLGGEARYEIAKGVMLSTIPFWEKAFGKSEFSN